MKDPAFLFYSSDFLSGTMTMTHEQVGKYIRLLCLQHQKTELTEKDMLFICGSYDEDIWNKFERGESGTFFNVRLKEEVLRRKAYSESRRNNRMKNISKSYVRHMETENETETVTKKKGGAGGKKQQATELVFEIPTLEQLITYADEKGFTDGIAYEFFEKYTNLQWKKNLNGEPIANWKLTMQTWMKRDYNQKWKKQQTTTSTQYAKLT